MTYSDALARLGVSRGADAQELRERYRELVKSCHPDVAGPAAQEHLRDILSAYRLVAGTTSRPRRTARRRPEPRPARLDRDAMAALLVWGRQATAAPDEAVRRAAVVRLASTGTHAAGTYLRQALYDTSSQVASSAAAALVSTPGRSAERALLAAWSTMASSAQAATVAAIGRSGASERFASLLVLASVTGEGETAARALTLLEMEQTS